MRDPRRLAESVVAAALSGGVLPQQPAPPLEVEFATTLHPERSDLGAQEFHETEGRIYGAFPVEE